MRLSRCLGALALGGLFGCWPLDDLGRYDRLGAAEDEPGTACRQGPWSRRFTGDRIEGWIVSSIDAAARVAVAGVHYGTIDLGAEAPLVAPFGVPLVFVVLLDSAGQTRWARVLAHQVSDYGGGGDFRPVAVAVDAADGVVVAGGLGPGAWIDGELVPPAAPNTSYLARLGKEGRTDYLQLWWASGPAQIGALVADGQGGVVAAGHFIGTLHFGSVELVGAADQWQPFLLGIDHDGVVRWSRQPARGSATISALARYPGGDLVLAGAFSGRLDLGGGELRPIGERTDSDIFLARLDHRGQHVWSRAYGDPENQAGPRLAVGSDGDIAVGGSLRGGIALGPGAVVMSTDPEGEAFAARLDGEGNPRFVQLLAGVHTEWVGALALADDGTMQLAGDFDGSITFGPQLGLIAAGERDLFAATLGADGSPRAGASYGSAATQRAAGGGGLCGDPVLVARCRGQIAFDPRELLNGDAEDADLCIARVHLGGGTQ